MRIEFFVYFLIFFGLFNITMAISFWLERKPKRKPYSINESLPKVSIIVPAYNEEKNIAKTLRNLLKLKYDRKKLEIIVVDDGSNDRTYKIAKKFSKFGIKIFRKPNGGKASAINYGIRKAKGEFIATLDADSYPEKDALLKVMPYFYDKSVVAVTSSILVQKPRNFWERIQYAEYLFGVFLRNAFSVKNALYVTPGPLSVYRAWFFKKHGPFDEKNICEDTEIAFRIQSLNYKIENAVDAKVYTIPPKSFKSLFKQRLRWYRGFLDNSINYKQLFNAAKYGFFSLILFFAYLSLIVVFGYIGYFAFKNFNLISDFIRKFSLIGFSIFKPSKLTVFNIKEFFLNNLSNPLIIFGIIGILTTLTLLFTIKRVADVKDKIGLSALIYIAFYGLIYWIFWAAVLFTKVFKIKVGWIR
ncbi:MAG: glycosyltransferase family 2 protein [Candidatus Pacearchaeota archaeon]